MKEKLEKKLSKLDRSKKWFWRENVKPIVTYQHFMEMVNRNSPMREDVEKIIKSFLEEK